MPEVLDRIYDKLIDGFIVYQHRLDHPWPTETETKAVLIEKYRSDVVFNMKVKSLASGVIRIVSDEIKKEETI